MSELTARIQELLCDAAQRLRDARLPLELADQMERLARQVDQPCVMAVVGRAKAGKSTFVNAFLGQDLAKVGVTETTATINFFCYGQPANPDLPVRCYWRSGCYQDVDRRFLDSLQGHDPETLRRAVAIEKLEYRLLHDDLREVTIVDTPGTEAAVKEHQNATAELLQLQRELREKHDRETDRWANQADAVIYLIGQVARATDKELLDEFRSVTGGKSRALNAIGVIAKIDLYPEARKNAPKIAAQLKDSLNTVVPVSAGLRRALDVLLDNNMEGLRRIEKTLARIPRARLLKLLQNHELYTSELIDCPVSVQERLRILDDMPWTVFTTVARQFVQDARSLELVVKNLDELAGFKTLRDTLERHFFRRAKLLRAFRTLNEARQILREVRFKLLPELIKLDRADQELRDRFLNFIRSARGDPQTAKELEDFVSRQLIPSRTERVEKVHRELDRRIGDVYHELEECNADFESLTKLEQYATSFNDSEYNELRALFGLYGMEIEHRLNGRMSVSYISDRMSFWKQQAFVAKDEIRRDVAERAEHRYGAILYELENRVP